MRSILQLLTFCAFLQAVSSLWCYSGLKYMIGQDERQDAEECDSFLGLTDEYCYRFDEHVLVQSAVKVGCASVICAPIGNDCGTVEFAGVTGTLCCCNANNYCNSASVLIPSRIACLMILLVLFLFFTF